MERFATWTDKATGIRPFIPLKLHMSNFKRYLRCFFGLLKLIAVFPLLLSLFILQILATPLPFLHDLFLRLFFKTILILFGYYSARCVPVPLINRIVEPESFKTPKKGTIVIAPLTSIINLLWLTANFSPQFLIPINHSTVVNYSIWSIVRKMIFLKDLREGEPVNFEKLVSEAKRPLVIFPEASTTNGLGLLKFVPLDSRISERTRLVVLGFKNEAEDFISKQWIMDVLRNFGRLVGSLKVISVLEKDIPDFSGRLEMEKIREITGRLLHLPLLTLSVDDHRQYLVAAEKQSKTD
jgi:hypothetical protein